VSSCLEKGTFRAIFKLTIPLQLATEAYDGMSDVAQSAQSLGLVTHH
jgi:hypothetical protein